jgi:hypothetical protein
MGLLWFSKHMDMARKVCYVASLLSGYHWTVSVCCPLWFSTICPKIEPCSSAYFSNVTENDVMVLPRFARTSMYFCMASSNFCFV